MTSCSQNRHTTKLCYTSKVYQITYYLKEVGFEPTIENSNRFTICHYKPLSHSFQLSKKIRFTFFRFNFLGRHPLCGLLLNIRKDFILMWSFNNDKTNEA